MGDAKQDGRTIHAKEKNNLLSTANVRIEAVTDKELYERVRIILNSARG
jgi:hypothetical protein